MKVIRMRTHYGVPALKGESSWGADDPGTELRMLPCGHFVVSKYGKHTIIPGAGVVSADVEPEPKVVMTTEIEQVTQIPIEGMTMTLKRGPGRPKKEQPT